MAFCVYIIQSERDGSYYKGFSQNPYERLEQHNRGESHYTSSKMPWKLVHVEEFVTKREALIRERVLKKYGNERISRLVASPKNNIR
ncbi:MAG: GIY-YIG nuclease family protein [Chitinophagaceae bacterium]|nr:GIY-YIG nuclease family protein [Chitinophagaceae bacterium]